jgi:hypothetical protein
MKSKSKRKPKSKPHAKTKYPSGQSPTEVGRAAGCSHVLAHRLLRRGMSPAEIVERCRLRREQEEARRAAAGGNGGGNGRAPVKGASTGGANGSESFVSAQARKERALASKHEVQLAAMRGDLVPIATVNRFFSAMIIKARDSLLRLPASLRDRLGAMDGAHCEALLDTELRFILRNLTLYGKEIAAAEQTAAEAAGPPPEPEPGR